MKDLLIDFDFFRHGVWKSILDEERCLQRAVRRQLSAAGKKELQAEQRVALPHMNL